MDFRLIVSCVLISTLSNSLDQHWKSFFFFFLFLSHSIASEFQSSISLECSCGLKSLFRCATATFLQQLSPQSFHTQYSISTPHFRLNRRKNDENLRESRKNIFMHKWLKGSIFSRIFSWHFFFCLHSFVRFDTKV